MFPHIRAWHTPDFKTSLNNFMIKFKSSQKFKNTLKMYKRYLGIKFSGQVKLSAKTIPADVKRILWLNCSSTSIGDSIMELSGRALLYGKYAVDLLTDKKNFILYTEDSIFQNVYTSVLDINANIYDFILVDVYNTKSLRVKTKYFKNIKFAGIHGFFYGLDFNRMLFSYHRINALLNYPYTQTQLDKLAKNILQVSPRFDQDTNRIIIAVGGEDIIRSYSHWAEVIFEIIRLFSNYSIALVGSQNGLDSVNQIQKQLVTRCKVELGKECEIYSATDTKLNNSEKIVITNYVNQLSLIETASLISVSGIFIGADGGLMHIAEAFGLKGVALFAKFRSEYRLAYDSKLNVLYDETDVSNILSQDVVEKIKNILE